MTDKKMDTSKMEALKGLVSDVSHSFDIPPQDRAEIAGSIIFGRHTPTAIDSFSATILFSLAELASRRVEDGKSLDEHISRTKAVLMSVINKAFVSITREGERKERFRRFVRELKGSTPLVDSDTVH